MMGQHAVQVGDTVEVGALLATIDAGDGAPAKAAAAEPAATATPAAAPAPAAAQSTGDAAAALSPSVRRAVLE
ncbi:hypothetical protein, partial [Clostridium perfringens]